MNTEKRLGQSGLMVMIVIGIVVIVGVIVLGIWALSKSKSEDTTKTGNTTSTSQGSLVSENQRLSQNLERKNDAQSVAGAVADFMNNNSGELPFKWDNGQVGGHEGTTPSSARLERYTEVFFMSGSAITDNPALTSDTIRVVTQATCGTDGSATGSSTGRGYAVQYSQALSRSGDSFEGKCLEG